MKLFLLKGLIQFNKKTSELHQMDRLADLKVGLLSKDSHSIDIRQEDEGKKNLVLNFVHYASLSEIHQFYAVVPLGY